MEKIDFRNIKNEVYATLLFNEELKCLHDTWYGAFGTQENFRKVLLTILEKCREPENRSAMMLTDVSNMAGSFDSSNEWIQTEMTPKFVQNGLKYHAMVIPKNIFSKLSVKDYIQKLELLEIRQFGEIEEAKKWLKSVS
jgi:hypothetical protein